MGSARSIDEIRADLARNRVRVADTVGAAASSANPKNLARQGANTAKQFVREEIRGVTGQFVDEKGVDIKRILLVGGAVVGLIAFAVTVNAVAGRRNKQIEQRIRRAIEAGA